MHRSVAKLVLLTFADPPPKCAKRTKHLDGDIYNNRLDNLAWEIPKTYYALPNPQARELFNREAERIVNIFVNKNLYNNISFGEVDIDDFKQKCLIRIWKFIDMVENYDYQYFYALCFKECRWAFNTFYKKYTKRHRYIYFSQLISDETENSLLDRLPELSYTEYFDANIGGLTMADAQRDKLIELLKGMDILGIPTDKFTEHLADYLLVNVVISPPCKVGDTVYKYRYRRKNTEKKRWKYIYFKISCYLLF